MWEGDLKEDAGDDKNDALMSPARKETTDDDVLKLDYSAEHMDVSDDFSKKRGASRSPEEKAATQKQKKPITTAALQGFPMPTLEHDVHLNKLQHAVKEKNAAALLCETKLKRAQHSLERAKNKELMSHPMMQKNFELSDLNRLMTIVEAAEIEHEIARNEEQDAVLTLNKYKGELETTAGSSVPAAPSNARSKIIDGKEYLCVYTSSSEDGDDEEKENNFSDHGQPGLTRVDEKAHQYLDSSWLHQASSTTVRVASTTVRGSKKLGLPTADDARAIYQKLRVYIQMLQGSDDLRSTKFFLAKIDGHVLKSRSPFADLEALAATGEGIPEAIFEAEKVRLEAALQYNTPQTRDMAPALNFCRSQGLIAQSPEKLAPNTRNTSIPAEQYDTKLLSAVTTFGGICTGLNYVATSVVPPCAMEIVAVEAYKAVLYASYKANRAVAKIITKLNEQSSPLFDSKTGAAVVIQWGALGLEMNEPNHTEDCRGFGLLTEEQKKATIASVYAQGKNSIEVPETDNEHLVRTFFMYATPKKSMPLGFSEIEGEIIDMRKLDIVLQCSENHVAAVILRANEAKKAQLEEEFYDELFGVYEEVAKSPANAGGDSIGGPASLGSDAEKSYLAESFSYIMGNSVSMIRDQSHENRVFRYATLPEKAILKVRAALSKKINDRNLGVFITLAKFDENLASLRRSIAAAQTQSY
mmetsp:Transcript_6772/g.10032  ORF Transcript_6772/g.10032 Transcript_6772/m.10032 type:complete len:698 (-) Transcript_6772:540-2633(-)